MIILIEGFSTLSSLHNINLTHNKLWKNEIDIINLNKGLSKIPNFQDINLNFNYLGEIK